MKRFLALVALVAFLVPSVSYGANTYSIDLEKDSSQYLSHADHAALSVTGDITMSVWFQPESLPTAGDQRILFGKETSYRIAYRVNGGNKEFICAVLVGGAEKSVLYTDNTIANGTWYNLRCSRSSATGEITLYKDGVQVATNATTAGAGDDTAGLFQVGYIDTGSGAGKDYFDGLIDEVQLWSTASPTVAYTACVVGNEANLAGAWHLDNDLDDATTNNNDLTNNNSAVFSVTVPAGLNCGAAGGGGSGDSTWFLGYGSPVFDFFIQTYYNPLVILASFFLLLAIFTVLLKFYQQFIDWYKKKRQGF